MDSFDAALVAALLFQPDALAPRGSWSVRPRSAANWADRPIDASVAFDTAMVAVLLFQPEPNSGGSWIPKPRPGVGWTRKS